MIFLDTNVILRFVLDDNPELSPKAAAIFDTIQNSKTKIYLPPVIVAEIVYVLLKVYKTSRIEISQKLLPILKIPAIKTDHKDIYSKVLKIFVNKNIDFEDAVMVVLMEKKGTTQLYSFDGDFDKFPQIKRLTA